jgi:hypothetical protein
MSRPSVKDCAAFVTNKDGRCNIRAARFGKAPLVHIWLHEVGAGGKSIILDAAQATELVEGLNDLLDQIEGVPQAS